MGNHEVRCTLDSILYASENGIILVTFPPYCSHLLQPLEAGVMGLFKGKLCLAQHNWMTANPHKVITDHDLASLSNAAYQASFTVKNITAPFAKPGTWPFSRTAFSEKNFEPSSVTPVEKELHNQEISVPFSSIHIAQKVFGTSKDSISPECVHPFPKPGPRCDRKQRKKAKSHILTDSPIKDCIEQETFARAAKRRNIAKGLIGSYQLCCEICQAHVFQVSGFAYWVSFPIFNGSSNSSENCVSHLFAGHCCNM